MDRPGLIQLALDCSLTHPEQFMAYAGVLAPNASIWWQGGQAWVRVLDNYELTHFRMTDAVRLQGPFHGWRSKYGVDAQRRRDELLVECVDVVKQVGLGVVGFAADVRVLSTKQRNLRKKQLFDAIVDQILDADIPEPRPYVGVLCDREQDLHALFLSWLQRLQVHHDPKYARLAGLCVLNSKIVPQLQIADLVVYLMREAIEQRSSGGPANPLFMRLSETPFRTLAVTGAPFGDQDVWRLVKPYARGARPQGQSRSAGIPGSVD